MSAKFARTVSPCIRSRTACAALHCSGVGLSKSGKGEEVACSDQALYFASLACVLFASGFDFEVSVDLIVDAEGLLSFGLMRVFATRFPAVAELLGYATPLPVILYAVERVHLVIIADLIRWSVIHEVFQIYIPYCGGRELQVRSEVSGSGSTEPLAKIDFSARFMRLLHDN